MRQEILMPLPLVSILIRTKNEAVFIGKSLDLVANQSVKAHQIIVVDSGSTDETVEIVQRWPDVNLIQIPAHEFTFGRSLNIGFEAVEGEVVVSLSAHAFPTDQNWLFNLIEHFHDPTVAGVYGRQLPQLDSWPPVQRDYLSFYKDKTRIQTDVANLHDHIFSNANSAIRFQCWKHQPFDEMLTGCEDQEWAIAMLTKGFKIIYEPSAAVYHSHNEPLQKVYQRTYRESLATKQLYHTEESVSQVLKKWIEISKADIKFILHKKTNWEWVFLSPIYRLFWVYGYLRPHLPESLWKIFLNRMASRN
jgi:rhamnosyltransferase